MKAVRLHESGSVANYIYEDAPDPVAGAGAGAALATRVGLDACGEADALLAAVGVAVIPPELTEAGAPVVGAATVAVLLVLGCSVAAACAP